VIVELVPVESVRLTSLAGDFATCTERSRGPVRRLGNMFEMRRPSAPLGAHGLAFLVEVATTRRPSLRRLIATHRGDDPRSPRVLPALGDSLAL
jgi:hypothetical protein